MDSSQFSYQLGSGYYGTHIESTSNQGLEDICTQHGIFFLKNWGKISSSPIIAQNNSYWLSPTQTEVVRIVRHKLEKLLSSSAGIAHIKKSNVMDILIGEFDPEVFEYIQTIEGYSEKRSILLDLYDVSFRNQEGIWRMREWSKDNELPNSILAILEWVKLNADGPVSVI